MPIILIFIRNDREQTPSNECWMY